MAPERVDLSHGVDQTIGEPRIDEAPVVGHFWRKRERRDHPVHLRSEGREPLEARVETKSLG